MQHDVQLHSQDFVAHKFSQKADEVDEYLQQVLDDPQEVVEIKKRVVEQIKRGDICTDPTSITSPMPLRTVGGGSVTPGSRVEFPTTPLSTGLRSRLGAGDTPFIKSSAMKSKRNANASFTMDASDASVNAHELQKIKSLYWLLQKDGRPEIDLLNKLEACKQANR